MKKVWLLNPYGTLPTEGWRKYRTTMVAEFLSQRDFEVNLFISNIDHRSKKMRSLENQTILIDAKYHISIIKSKRYHKNASLKRVLFERSFFKQVYNQIQDKNRYPDLIIIFEPALFCYDLISKIIEATKAKIVIDILDLWPEVFITLFPKRLRSIINFSFTPLYKLRELNFKKAIGIIGATKDYLEIGLLNNKQIPGKVVYLGFDLLSINEDQTCQVTLQKKTNESWIIYSGTLGLNYDISSILKCSKLSKQENLPYRFLIAGDGPLSETVKQYIYENNLDNVTFLGRLSSDELSYYYLNSDIALSTYMEGSTVSMPVKAFDYFAYGLPIVNSLTRELMSIISQYNVGMQYKAEDHEDMLNKIRSILSHTELMFKMKANAKLLSNMFDVSIQYDIYGNFLSELINEKT